MRETKLVVLDDDPTGSQTVHGCLLLTRWDTETLREALLDASPLFFVLTNTRAMDAARAETLTREVCRNLRTTLDALADSGRVVDPILISRSDSTLRGHYPVETDVIADELGPFDAHFLIPAFIEGGRITREGVHYLLVDGRPVPVSETEFARDSVFGYHHAYLPDYVEEKTRGRIRAEQVERFGLAEIRAGSLARLLTLTDNVACVVDAESHADLTAFAADLRAATRHGSRRSSSPSRRTRWWPRAPPCPIRRAPATCTTRSSWWSPSAAPGPASRRPTRWRMCTVMRSATT